MSALSKNTYREILRSPGRFLAILAIIVLGSGFFVGLRVSQKAMTATADTYLEKTRFYDYSVSTTLGLTDEDVEAILADPNVLDAEGSFELDALVTLDGSTEIVYSFHSLPERVNIPNLLEGRLPEAPDECLADSWGNLDLGDKVTISAGNDRDTLDKFTVRELTVTGIVTSPLYLNFERGSASIGSGTVTSFCYVPMECFDTDYYTTVYMRCTDMPGAYTAKYDKRSEELEPHLTRLADARADARYNSIVSDAEAELQKGRDEYDDACNEYLEKRADAEAELADAKAQLEDAWRELKDAAAKIEDGRRELADGKAELAENEKTLLDAKRELEDAKRELDDAKRQLDEGWEEYDRGASQLNEERYKGQQELGDAKAQLDAAKSDLDAGEAEYSDNLALYEDYVRQYNEGLAQYNSGAAELAQYEKEYNDGVAALESGKTELRDGLQRIILLSNMGLPITVPYTTVDEFYDALMAGEQAALDALNYGLKWMNDPRTAQEVVASIQEGEKTLADGKASIDAGRAKLEAAERTLSDSRAQLNDASVKLDEGRAELDSGWAEYESGLAEYERGLAEFNASITQAEKELSEANDRLLEAQAEYDRGLAEYRDGLREYEDGLQRFNDGKAELESAEAELADAEKEYARGLSEYEDGLSEYEDARSQADREFADAEAELADAKAELEDARREIDELAHPDAYLLGRWGNLGYSCFESDTSIVKSISSVFPLFFFLVAALICVTTVSRMVEEQRSQLGVLMALGYSPMRVMAKFLIYSGTATVLGCTIGILLGSRVIPWVVWQAYDIMYGFSGNIEFYFDFPLSAVTFLAYLAAMLLVTYISCRREINDVPANVIRPKPPKSGKRVILERVPFIWNRLSFLWKVTVRNIFRYKSRVLMMILGVAGCTALMLTGMGINDSIKNVVDYQFTEVSLYDFSVTFSGHLTEEQREEFMADTADVSREALFLHQSTVNAAAGRAEKEVQISAVDAAGIRAIPDFVSFHRGSTPLPFPGKGEALINSGLADDLGLKTGDTFEIRPEEGPNLTLTVSGVYDNYIYNTVYVSTDTYPAQGDPDINYALVLKRDGVDTGKALASILGRDGVLTASASLDMRERIGNMMESLIYIVLLTVICAAALAFVVIYNLTNINIQERLRELATVKVLGFYNLESALYVLRENLLLTVLGAAAGVPMGIALNAYVISCIDLDIIHFTPRVLLPSYLWSIALTFLFSLLVDAFMYTRLTRINPAEALKAAE